MKEEIGDSKLFWAEILMIIGAIFLSKSLIGILKVSDGWFFFYGLVLVIFGAAWKSSKK